MPMPDKYSNFSELSSSEPDGSYKIELRQTGSAVALIAPHAGKIEPGTSQICKHVAKNDLTFYLFEGCKPINNRDLHITSSNFDEPQGLSVAQSAQVVVTFHGQKGADNFVNVGGRFNKLCQTMIGLLLNAGYPAIQQNSPALQGLDRNNICNRGTTGQGLQLEISRGLRNILVSDKVAMAEFSSIVRAALQQSGL
jgi:phage replication-related protein YjqB (UPF0714/DUF867 family)